MLTVATVRATMAAAAAAAPPATRLDTVFPNDVIDRAGTRFAKQGYWEETHVLAYRTQSVNVKAVVMAAVSHSWATASGVDNIGRRLRGRAARLCELGSSGETTKMLTLTFADAAQSWSGGAEVRRFLGALVVWGKRNGHVIDYLWVAELQSPRLAVHYHVILAGMPYVPAGRVAEWWGCGFVKIRAVPAGDALRYCLKYVRKAVNCYSGDQVTNAGRQVVMGVLCRAARLRRYGSTRALSAPDARLPAWAMEACAELGLPPELTRAYVIAYPNHGELTCFGESYFVDIGEHGRWVLLAGSLTDVV